MHILVGDAICVQVHAGDPDFIGVDAVWYHGDAEWIAIPTRGQHLRSEPA